MFPTISRMSKKPHHSGFFVSRRLFKLH